MPDILKLRREFKELTDLDPEKNREGMKAAVRDLERSPMYFRDHLTSRPVQIPFMMNDETLKLFMRIVDTSYGIFSKVINEYLTCEDYRRLFPFSKELEELILTPAGYDCLVPVTRFDIFYHEDTGDFWFCEVNTDGTSGMNEDRIQDETMIHNPAFQEMRRRYQFRSFELFDSWVDRFMQIYSTYERRVEDPNIAVIDFMDGGTVREFEEFARHFQKKGYNCEVCDIRDLTYRDGKLWSPAGHTVDAIYRRAVTGDIMDRIDEVRPFIQAVKDGAVFLAGHFRTQIIHHKAIFQVIHLKRTLDILTEEERQFVKDHIPFTAAFENDDELFEKVLKNKDDYILKPWDSYQSMGVTAGPGTSEEDWEKAVRSAYGGGYLVQAYAPQYYSENRDFVFSTGEWEDFMNMTGLYVYGGQFAGVFARLAPGKGIIARGNERTQPAYLVRDRQS